MKHVFIVNDRNSKKVNDKIAFVEKICRMKNYDYIIERTTSAKHAVILAKHYAQLAGEPASVRIYAVGGDGTANEIASGILSSGHSHLAEMAVIPTGTGNDFVRALLGNNMSNQNLEDYITDLFESTPAQIDAVRVNDGYALNILSVGIDAETNYNLHKFTKKFTYINTKVAYILSAVSTFTRTCNMDLEVRIDDGPPLNKRLILAAIANGYYYGGGICPCPDSRLSDGYLDACLIDAVTRPRIITLIPSFLKSKHLSHPEVNIMKIKKIHFKANKEMILNIDGEIMKSDHLNIEIMEKSLLLVSPAWALKNL